MIDQNSITAYATLFTAIATGALAIVTWIYAKLVKDQAAMMREQLNFMNENLIQEKLMIEYNRLLTEMNQLVAPLHSRIGNETIFGLPITKNRNDLEVQGYNPFWNNIKQYMYLNSKLGQSVNDYFSAIDNYWDKKGSSEIEAISRAKLALIEDVENRYKSINKEIKDMEKILILNKKYNH